MRVLMTGATSLQTKAPEFRRAAVTKIDVPAAVRFALQALGHDVEWGPCPPGAELSGHYDLLWINVAGVLSLNSTPGAPGMLWALSQTKVPAVIFLDDWKTQLTFNQARSFSRSPEKYWDKHLLTKVGELVPGAKPTHYSEHSARQEYERVVAIVGEHAARYSQPSPFYAQRKDFTEAEWNALRADVQRGARYLGEGRVRSAIGIPAYTWGDTDIVRPTLPEPIRRSVLHRVDPSHLAIDVAAAVPRPMKRHDRWGLAALGDFKPWLAEKLPDLKWDVEMVGHNSNRKLKTEHDVVRMYGESGGVLSPSYYHAGSGWWRSRFIYAMMMGVPIYATNEAWDLGDPYRVHAYDIEAMSATERDQLAHQQFNALHPRLSTYPQFVDQVETLVASAMA